MNEVHDILEKYEVVSISEISKSEESINKFISDFSTDLGRLIDVLSRIVNTEKYPNNYNLNEATVVGSVTRIIKLFQELIHFYKQNKLEIFTQFMRPLYETFTVAKYLMRNGAESQRNFRLISYRARYENYKKLTKSYDKDNPIIARQIRAIEAKLVVDEFTFNDLAAESNKKSKSWKLDGKSFWKIHSEVDCEELYSFLYGVGSDSVHGSWQEIMDFHLTREGEGYFGFLNYEKCDCRALIPLNSMVIEILREFLIWNDCATNEILAGLNSMKSISNLIYTTWEKKFGEPSIEKAGNI